MDKERRIQAFNEAGKPFYIAAHELLDQEVTAFQTDLFDTGLVRLKTEESEQEMVPSATM